MLCVCYEMLYAKWYNISKDICRNMLLMGSLHLRRSNLFQCLIIEAFGHFDCIDAAQLGAINALIDVRAIAVCICSRHMYSSLFITRKKHI